MNTCRLSILLIRLDRLLALVLLLSLQACQSISYQPIISRELFLDKVVDKPLSWPGGYNVRFNSDGTIIGAFPGGKVEGEWDWIEGMFCRSIRIGNQPRPDECLQIEYGGDQIRFKRASGDYFLPYRIDKDT